MTARDDRNLQLQKFIGAQLAAQIKDARLTMGKSQAEFGSLLCFDSSRIAAMERSAFHSYTLRTLLNIARALDVALVVKFVPFNSSEAPALPNENADLV